MLTADSPNVDDALETARRTVRDGHRASDVITRLRALLASRDATSESVDLNEATREAFALSLGELQRGRVVLRVELAGDLPIVTGDRVQLQQVIPNLFRNASDAMSVVDDRPRRLVIRTERDEDDRVRLTVQDAGVGLEPKAMDTLLQAFGTTKRAGRRIGLSVSRSIIESHHGRVWAAPNDGPGARTRCLILDIAMPGMSGPDVQRELTRCRQKIPIVFITAHRDETVRPRLLEQGAVECLFKPFSETALLEALHVALAVP
jgi:C4-dicarboxylate-specific signal transduction histidine kinase